MQLLALRLGGELIHDIATQCASAQPHRLTDGDTHGLSIVPGSRLAGLLGPALEVNSRHHQAVSVAGPRLIVSARADDGLIEGVELPEPAGFAVGVQWHPETMPRGHRQALFGALVAAASGRQAREPLSTSVS
jgi:putative glutamine amidotransferase